ncbi:MAG: sterol desaturase family protein [Myxococcales bacterium]|nr:sterol desaturase family protein [Myxococcales bacterium]
MFPLPDYLRTVWGIFLFLVISSAILYYALSGLSYWYFFVLKKEKYHPKYKRNKDEIKMSMKWAMYSLLGNAVLTAPIHYLIDHGYTRVYFNISDFGWGWFFLSALVVLIVTETMIYWIHRWLHHPALYKHIHLKHHQFRKPTPWASVAFHPLDSFAQAFPHHLCAFLFPVHIVVYLSFLSFVTVWAVLIHDRVSFIPWKIVNYTGHHTAHHWYNKYNYGQFFTIWDRIGGTYRDPDDLPAKALDI